MGKIVTKKCLFITNGLIPYGSGKSLKYLLAGLPNVNSVIWVPRGIVPWPKNVTDHAKKAFGNNVNEAYSLPLPDTGRSYIGAHFSTKFKVMGDIATIFYRFLRTKYSREINENNYQLIHINTTVLAECLTLSTNAIRIQHVREMIAENSKTKIFRLLNHADGIICIDNSAKKQLPAELRSRAKVITNPVNMTKKISDAEIIKFKESIGEELKDKIVISIVGRINPTKGVNLGVEALTNCKRSDILFLVAGDGDNNSEYYKQFLRKLRVEPRIRFLNFLDNIEVLYSVTDYLLRCDPDAWVGRTILEGVHSGCRIIMPSSESILLEPGLVGYEDRFFLYEKLNVKDLTRCFNSLPGKVINRQFTSSVDIYAKNFTEFVDEIAHEKGLRCK